MTKSELEAEWQKRAGEGHAVFEATARDAGPRRILQAAHKLAAELNADLEAQREALRIALVDAKSESDAAKASLSSKAAEVTREAARADAAETDAAKARADLASEKAKRAQETERADANAVKLKAAEAKLGAGALLFDAARKAAIVAKQKGAALTSADLAELEDSVNEYRSAVRA